MNPDERLGSEFTDFLMKFREEVVAFLAVAPEGRREHLLTRVGVIFDAFAKETDVPGPDAIVEPIMRAALLLIVAQLYDTIVRRFSNEDGPIPWPALPAKPE